MTVSELNVGARAVVTDVKAPAEIRRRLAVLGIRRGAELFLLGRSKNSCIVGADGLLAVGKRVARCIFVRTI